MYSLAVVLAIVAGVLVSVGMIYVAAYTGGRRGAGEAVYGLLDRVRQRRPK